CGLSARRAYGIYIRESKSANSNVLKTPCSLWLCRRMAKSWPWEGKGVWSDFTTSRQGRRRPRCRDTVHTLQHFVFLQMTIIWPLVAPITPYECGILSKINRFSMRRLATKGRYVRLRLQNPIDFLLLPDLTELSGYGNR